MCCPIAHNPEALGSTGRSQCSGPSSLLPLSNTLSGPSAGVTQFLMKLSFPSLLLLANKKLCFRATPPRDAAVVRFLPLPQGAEQVSLSLSLRFPGCSRWEAPLTAGRLKATRTPNKAPASLPFLFFPSAHLPFPYRQLFQRHFKKQREATGSILFPAAAGPSHSNGCAINSSPCVCSVFLSQPPGADALQLINHCAFPLALTSVRIIPIQTVRNPGHRPRKYQCWLLAGSARKPHPTSTARKRWGFCSCA